MGSAVSSVGDLLEFGVGDLVDMFSVTQKQIRTITVGSMDLTTDAIFSKLDGMFYTSKLLIKILRIQNFKYWAGKNPSGQVVYDYKIK